MAEPWRQKSQPDVAASRQSLIKPDPEDCYPESLAPTGHYGTTAPGLLSNGHQGYFDGTDYQTPNLKRAQSDRSAPNTPDDGMGSKYRRWPSETATTDSAPVSELPSESNDILGDEDDSNKLKGVRYPGMGLFDSADEVQKRMRNQRKDDSVLKQMEETSSGIEPTEFVWTEDGEFQRMRDIYASPSIEGSPVCHPQERVGVFFLAVKHSTNSASTRRTASSRSAKPTGGSEAVTQQSQRHRSRPASGPRQLGSLGECLPVSRVLLKTTSFSMTTMRAAGTQATAMVLPIHTTSFVIRQSRVPV